jgi:integrase
MARRSKFPLLYLKRGRWYANLKAYAPWGGGCEAMRPPGQRFATADQRTAEAIMNARLADLERARRLNPHPRQVMALAPSPEDALAGLTFASYAETAFDAYEEGHLGTAKHAQELRQRARVFAAFLASHVGPRVLLKEVTKSMLRAFLKVLTERGLSEPTQRHYLNAVSMVYKQANEADLFGDSISPNPARALERKPHASRGGEAFLETHEAALLLDTAAKVAAAHSHPSPARDAALASVAIACGLLTGGRRREVMGLLVEDVQFERGRIRFAPRSDRGLKTRGSDRQVPLWPQLRDVLRAWLNAREAAVIAEQARPSRFLFPTPDGYGWVQDIGKCFETAVAVAGLESRFRSEWWRVLRRSYCTARLMTTDGGAAAVSSFKVSKELGHSTSAMIDKVYGKIADLPHRSPVVEYRLDPAGFAQAVQAKVDLGLLTPAEGAEQQQQFTAAIAARDKRLKALAKAMAATPASLTPTSEAEVIATR